MYACGLYIHKRTCVCACTHRMYLWLIECKLIWKNDPHLRDTPATVFEKRQGRELLRGSFLYNES